MVRACLNKDLGFNQLFVDTTTLAWLHKALAAARLSAYRAQRRTERR